MENEQQLWQQCLQLIQQQLMKQKDHEWVYDTWFKPITCINHDNGQNTVLVQVPSIYIYEYIEHYYARLLGWALRSVYGAKVKLQYRIRANAYGHPINLTQEPPSQRISIRIPDAGQRMKTELHKILGDRTQWLPGYDSIVSWLTDNEGKGLVLIGTPGLGKTLICRHILPTLFGCNIPTFTAREMNTHIDEILKKRIVIIDDLGTEDVEYKNYGNSRRPFSELCDNAEQNGNLLIITTNLSTTPVSDPRYPMSIKARYGDATYSRFRTIMKSAIIEGEDLRGKKI